MKGDLVIVRAFGGKPLVRRVWEVVDDKVYICNEETFQNLLKGFDAFVPVGFPKSDVFYYTEDVENVFTDDSVNPELWQHLTAWSS